MAKKIKFPIPKEDVPAWFMTYSDVVTLLMTFFILLLTFATMEPERYDRIERTISQTQSATGRVGLEIKGIPKDAWVNRVRPPSARIALRGAEMPPITQAPVKESYGKGLMALDPQEHKNNELESHYFDIELNQLLDRTGNVTPQGAQVLGALAAQLNDLPFQAAIQFSHPDSADQIVQLMTYLFEREKIRPGQLSMTRVHAANLTPDRVRFLIKRYLVKPS